jgi:hypothetical protein
MAADLARRCRRGVEANVSDDHAGTRLREAPYDRLADATCRSRYQRHPSFEHHARSLRRWARTALGDRAIIRLSHASGAAAPA